MQNLKALFLNASLKSTSDPSHTEGFMEDVKFHYNQLGVESEIIRLADYKIAHGVQEDMGDGDEWPQILEKVMAADILIIGTPIWLGEKSSLCTQAIERLYGSSSVTNDKGQAVFYNKVGGAVVTGNEDGAKHSASEILYSLSHIGFTVPRMLMHIGWVKQVRVTPIWTPAGTMTLRSPPLNGWLITHTISQGC